MSIEEENKAIHRRVYEEIWNKGNLEILNEFFDSNYVLHSTRGDTNGTEGLKQAITMFRTAFPDLHCTIEDMVAEGNKVARRITSTGTFKGELMGIAPTGRQVTHTEAIFYSFEGGKAVEAWNYSDQLTMFQQLGVNPPSQ
jgi:steroid delta-isomerase-like uncharacterized protein